MSTVCDGTDLISDSFELLAFKTELDATLCDGTDVTESEVLLEGSGFCDRVCLIRGQPADLVLFGIDSENRLFDVSDGTDLIVFSIDSEHW